MRFKIITLGCKVNTYESEFMLESLLCAGYIYDEEKPDIIIINTCSVTNESDKKSLKIIRRAKREHPDSILAVVGCSAQNHQEKYQELGVEILLGNKSKSQIVSIIAEYLKTKKPYTYFINDRTLPFEDMQVSKFTTHTRAFIKIQDGCDNFCSYCIIPYTRGSIRSKDFNKTIEEAKTLVLNGHKEIVLTGIHTGSYNFEGRKLSDLIAALSLIPGLKRIRISSLEITEIDQKLLDLFKTNPKLAHHLHIPLQSGSDIVLKKMNRKYDTSYFRQKIAEIRSICLDISLTTDCIVGHPYETDECFLDYLAFCQEIAFSKLHVFPYSPRQKTASARMPEIDQKTKKDRVHALLSLSKKLEEAYGCQFLNQKLDVITEEYVGDYTVGFTSNYLRVYLKGEYKLNCQYACLLDTYQDGIFYAHITSCLNEEITI